MEGGGWRVVEGGESETCFSMSLLSAFFAPIKLIPGISASTTIWNFVSIDTYFQRFHLYNKLLRLPFSILTATVVADAPGWRL